MDVLDGELEKVVSFFTEREGDAVARYKDLEDQLAKLEEHREQYNAQDAYANRIGLPLGLQPIIWMLSRITSVARLRKVTEEHAEHVQTIFRPEGYMHAKHVLKIALLELYKLLNLIRSYKTVNRTGFSKVLGCLSDNLPLCLT